MASDSSELFILCSKIAVSVLLSKLYRYPISAVALKAQWSSSMIPASGKSHVNCCVAAGGPGFNSRLSPFAGVQTNQGPKNLQHIR